MYFWCCLKKDFYIILRTIEMISQKDNSVAYTFLDNYNKKQI